MHPLEVYYMSNEKTVSSFQVISAQLTTYIAGQGNLRAVAQKEKKCFHKHANELLETTAMCFGKDQLIKERNVCGGCSRVLCFVSL